MSTNAPYIPPVPIAGGSYSAEWAQNITQILNALASKVNCTTTVTLTANAGSTTLTDPRLFSNSCLAFMPTTAHAASVHASIYVTNQAKGTAKINHTNDANTDKTFTVAILG